MRREQYIDKLSAQLKEWDTKLEKYENKALQARGDAEMEFKKRIADLREKKAKAGSKLQKMKESSSVAFEELKTGTEEAFEKVKNAFKSAFSKFD